MHSRPNGMAEVDEGGVGATDALSLRVSVATLVRVLLASPEDGRRMLVLERTATLQGGEGGSEVSVVAKPFGGAVQIVDPRALQEAIGDFHYDSERSRRERDFRLNIHPESWEAVKRICRAHLRSGGGSILDTSPDRELAEEFGDALGLTISPGDYRSSLVRMLVDNAPRKTRSVRAPGRPTVRIYYVFEAWLDSPDIVAAALESGSRTSDQDLRSAALGDAREGGRGRANGALVLGFEEVCARYRATPTHPPGEPLSIGGHRLAGNVPMILDGIHLARGTAPGLVHGEGA